MRAHTVSDSEVLDFALRWSRYGGGPTHEIRERFGMSDREFFFRVLDILDRAPRNVGAGTAERLRHVAHQRLWLARADVPVTIAHRHTLGTS
ncbi:DUF3263 domain-containing protein [Gordonia sp. CPCC 206044]|uniref:DUF3263 domain-containing protein n=1 Tax=Gordonia sp. CPCC 206044 TaxID=3140793 RepID=UPI003AF3C666